LLSHAEPKGDLMRVMKRGLEALRSELLKTRFGMGRKPRSVRPRTSEPQAASEAPAPQPASRFGTPEGVKRTRILSWTVGATQLKPQRSRHCPPAAQVEQTDRLAQRARRQIHTEG
jgi:hypothetical protein